MRALVFTRPSTLELRYVDEPVAGDGEVVIEVEATGVGGGEIYQLHHPGDREFPSIMGHGIAGTDDQGRRVAVDPVTSCETCTACLDGRRQHCSIRKIIGIHSNGGFAERCAVPAANLVALPDSLTWEQTAFIEPFANAVHAWHVGEATADMSVGLIGAGAIGLGVVAQAVVAGAGVIEVAEQSESRADVATAMGATKVGATLTGHHDIVFDAVGTPRSRAAAVSHTATGGTVVLLGLESETPGFDANEVVRRELRLQASYVYQNAEFAEAIELAGQTESDWIASFGFDGLQDVIDDFSVGDYSIVRAALRPGLQSTVTER